MKNKLIMMMGIPGSGKSTKAKTLAPTDCICEADNFWFNDKGEYVFVAERLGQAHGWCINEVDRLMGEGKHTIVVANTNITPRDRKPYKNLAEQYGYEYIIELPDSPWFMDILPRLRNKTFTDSDVQVFVEKNIHRVPAESIRKMMGRWDESDN